jgi:hypothetical protein
VSNLPDILRLLRKVSFGPGDCWTWAGWRHEDYGYCWYQGKTCRVQRVMYRLFRGVLPDHLTTDHLCRYRSCCNPWHLEPVTGKVNNARSESLTALNMRKSHCVSGHELAGDNVYHWEGKRICRACAKVRDRKRKQRIREERNKQNGHEPRTVAV